MATPVGALSIDLSLNSAAFVRDAGKSQRALASNSAKMNKALSRLDKGFNRVLRSSKSMAKSMLSMRGVMAGVAGAAGIGLLVKKSIEFADAIGKAADAIGISTGTLQEYRFALDLAGVSTETTDKGLTKFVRNMGELGRTSSETQTALKDLDPTLLQNLRSLKTVEEQLAAGFRALAGYENQQKRAAVAASLFGRAGVKLTVAVKNGIAAFEGLRQRARDLGIVLEDKLIRNAETAKDELTVLAQVIKIKVIGAVVAFAPQITNLATAFADGIPKIVKWVEELGKFFGLIEKQKSVGIQEIGVEIANINSEIARLESNIAFFEKLGIKFDTSTQKALVIDLRREVAVLRAEIERIINTPAAGAVPAPPATTAPQPGASIVPAAGLAGVKANKFIPAHPDADFLAGAEQAARVRREAIIAEGALAEATRKTTEEMIRQADQTAVLMTATRQGTEAVRAQEEIFELQNAALAQGIDLTTAQGEAWEDAFRSVQIFNRGLEDSQREMEEAREAAQELADVLTDVVGEAIDGNIRSWEDLGRVAIRIIGDILKEQINAAIKAQALGGSGGGGFLGSIFGFLGGLFGGGGANAQVAGDLAGGVAFSTPFAHGGTGLVTGSGGTDSKLAVLRVTPGEEIAVRTPAQQQAARGGGGPNIIINQHNDFRGAEAGVFAKAQLFKRQIKDETIAAVFGLMNHGGKEAIMSGRRRGQRR